MNRRGFLATLAGVSSALVFDPAMFGWVKHKTIFIPKPQPFYPKFYSVDIHFTYEELQLEFWKAQPAFQEARARAFDVVRLSI